MNKLLIMMIGAVVVCSFTLSCAHARAPFKWYKCDISNISFDDGDSFACKKTMIRVLGIDTPEIMHKRQGIFVDQKYGVRASEFTKNILKSAKRIVIIPSKKDKYGRTLAHVLVDGELLGVKLIKAGLAYETISYYGDNGFPEFALQIREASKGMPKPDFMPPYLWRRKHQKRH